MGIASRPEIIRAQSGEVRWLRPGMHHLRNLLATPVRFVTLETVVHSVAKDQAWEGLRWIIQRLPELSG